MNVNRYSTLTVTAICLGFLLLIVSCGEEGPDIDTESAIPVSIETLTRKPISEYVTATGTVKATQTSDLTAQQWGYYQIQTNPRTGEPFAMGDTVLQGEVIIKLRNQEFVNEIAIESKKLNYEVSEREFEKQKALYDKGGVTLRELTDSERAYIDARYSYQNALLQLEKLSLSANFDGILADLPYYANGQRVESGTVLGRVMNYETLHCSVSLPAKELGRVRAGQKLLVTNYTETEDTLTGSVVQVSPALDADSRMFEASLLIDNDSLIFRPGMFVKVDIEVASRDSALVIPKDVVMEQRRGKTVFVVEKGVALQRTIDTGLESGSEIEVTKGLEEDERLIVEGFETLRNGSRVRVVD